jgi:hypothetical protein
VKTAIQADLAGRCCHQVISTSWFDRHLQQSSEDPAKAKIIAPHRAQIRPPVKM